MPYRQGRIAQLLFDQFRKSHHVLLALRRKGRISSDLAINVVLRFSVLQVRERQKPSIKHCDRVQLSESRNAPE